MLKKIEPHDDHERTIQAILHHPLETEDDWKEVARLIDQSEVMCLIKDPPNERVTVYFNDAGEVALEGRDASRVWQAFDDNPH